MKDKHFEKILYNSSYKIDEDAKFNRIDQSFFDDDEDFSDLLGEDEENEDAEETEVESEENDEISDEDLSDENIGGEESDLDSGNEENFEEENNSESEVDKVQNEIIKTNINTMNMIHGKLKELEDSIKNLDNQYQNLQKDVEDVKEPSNAEKLKSHAEDSFPYYKNLNDLWQNGVTTNDNEVDDTVDINTNNMKRLKDGSYVAIFDDLDDMSSADVNKSFYQYE